MIFLGKTLGVVYTPPGLRVTIDEALEGEVAAKVAGTREIATAHAAMMLAGRKILCKRFSTKSRMVLESRADSGLNPLITESHGGQNGMRAGAA